MIYKKLPFGTTVAQLQAAYAENAGGDTPVLEGDILPPFPEVHKTWEDLKDMWDDASPAKTIIGEVVRGTPSDDISIEAFETEAERIRRDSPALRK